MAEGTFPAIWMALAVAATLGLTPAGHALAVDLPPAPGLPPAAASSDDFSGWYLRGDVGAGFETPPDLGSAGPVAIPGCPVSPTTISTFQKASLSPSATLDAGLGYVFNSWVRMDATLEYRFGGRLQSTYAVAGSGPVAAGRLRGGVSSLVALLDGYVDLGNWWGATPFVGVGIGVADNALSGVSDQGFAFTGGGSAIPVGGALSNASRTNFAWALTAGLDFEVAPNLKLELSYRHLNLGSIAVGGTHCFPGSAACLGAGVATEARGRLASNDVRIGLVYLIGEPPGTPAPVVARY